MTKSERYNIERDKLTKDGKKQGLMRLLKR